MNWLRWGIHEGFFRYVESIPDCTIEMTGGVTRTADGEFVFPAADTRYPDRNPGALHFAGRVTVWAYEGLLRVELINPVLDPNADGGLLLIENPHRAGDLVAAARLGARSSESGYITAAATLTSQGTGWLSEGRYPGGTEVAPVSWTPAQELA